MGCCGLAVWAGFSRSRGRQACLAGHKAQGFYYSVPSTPCPARCTGPRSAQVGADVSRRCNTPGPVPYCCERVSVALQVAAPWLQHCLGSRSCDFTANASWWGGVIPHEPAMFCAGGWCMESPVCGNGLALFVSYT